MTYNLTDNQKDLARFLVKQVREGNLKESFLVLHGLLISSIGNVSINDLWSRNDLVALSDAQLLSFISISQQVPHFMGDSVTSVSQLEESCVLKGLIYRAVDTDFAEPTTAPVLATLDNPHPPEITISLKRLRERFPDEKKTGFLIMRFGEAKPYPAIVEAIKSTAKQHGLDVIRADENEFHDNLWENVQTHMHGCSFGIAVYERIAFEQPNANVGLEVGYMMAMNKPVLLLKDKTVAALQTDLAGKLYKEFDPHDAASSIPVMVEKWLRDKGIVVGQALKLG